MIDASLKSNILDIFGDLALGQEDRERFSRYVDAIWAQCIEERAFGYSAHYEALVPSMPRIYRMIRPLVEHEDQLKRLFSATPNILRWIPYTSEEGYLGYTHHLILTPLQHRVEQSDSFEDFIAGFDRPHPVTVCSECGRDMTVKKLAHGVSLSCSCGFSVVC